LLSCRPLGPVPLPERAPEVVWRAGIDLNPLDLNDDDDMAWLSCLLWPGEADRAGRLQGAIAAARRQPPPIHRGDLLDDLARVGAQAPADATLVVYHSAVLAYVDVPKRQAFAAAVRDLGATWLSNEGDGVLPSLATGPGTACFLLVRDGEEVLARTDPHGTWLEWLTLSTSEQLRVPVCKRPDLTGRVAVVMDGFALKVNGVWVEHNRAIWRWRPVRSPRTRRRRTRASQAPATPTVRLAGSSGLRTGMAANRHLRTLISWLIQGRYLTALRSGPALLGQWRRPERCLDLAVASQQQRPAGLAPGYVHQPGWPAQAVVRPQPSGRLALVPGPLRVAGR
jgi:hypothetical protein